MEANENKFNPFTAARRDKFKCALFCFRSYVEDTAMFIAIIGICLTVVFALLLHDIDPHGGEGRGIHANNDTAGIQLFLGTLFSMCLNFGVIAALITRIPAFCAPYLLVQLISLGMVGYRFAENGLIAIDTSSGSHFSQWKGISDNDRSIALNSFVLLGLLLLFDMWIFSIVWRAMRAIGWERTSKKLVQDLVEHQREGRRQQTSQPSASAPVHSIA